MHWLLRVLVVLVVTISAITLAGIAQPRFQNRTVEIDILAQRSFVWKILNDYTSQPIWRKELAQVAMQPAPRPDMRKWAEFGKDGGTVMVQTVTAQAPEMLELQFYGNLSGLRKLQLSEIPGGTHLKLEEQIEIHNPILRFVRMFSSTQEKNQVLDHYLAQLKAQAEK
jgi:hypothetical protein